MTITKKEGWFKLDDHYIVLRFSKDKSIKVVIIKGDSVVSSYIIHSNVNCSNTQIIVDGIDICNELMNVINNYNDLLEQYELIERAKAANILNDRMVPSMPKEFNILLYSLTKKLLDTKIIKTFYIYEGGREIILGIYCYENGYYRECEETLKNELTKIIKDSGLLDIQLAPTVAGLVVKNIEIRTMEYYEFAKHCLLFKNKVFCWDPFLQTKDIEKALIDPNPNLVVIHRIPWELKPEILKNVREGLLKYVPPKNQEDLIELFKALAPKSFKAFLDWVKKPGENENDAYPRVVLLLEIIGYTLYPHDYPLHKAALLVGDGSNGKSTYLKLIEKILSKQNIASVSLTELDPNVNRFASADLFGKLANISSEPAKGLFDPTRFKMATGEDPMPFERKHRDRFTGHNYAKMIFAANTLPEVKEDTYAYWRRWIVIEFPNRFKPDPEFFSKTFTPDEIEAIILLSLHAFRLVLERKEFTESGVNDIRDEWMNRSNPIYFVVKKMIEEGLIKIDPNGYIVKKDLYMLYIKYVRMLKDQGYDVKFASQKSFTEQLARLMGVRTGDKKIGTDKKHCYIGISIADYDKFQRILGYLPETPRQLTDVAQDPHNRTGVFTPI
ncbi:MAG: phage/plasmid primase, P4 family [Ignisphaera sp.]